MRSAVGRAFKQLLKTTTLHGFKYLCSPFYFDRAFWLAWCCASACCAGVLCAVVWARFLQLPTLLALANTPSDAQAPLVAVCPTPARVAQLFVEQLPVNKQQSPKIPVLLNKIIRGKLVPDLELSFLEHLLSFNNLTLSEALLNATPTCAELVRRCRWQDKMVPCDQLFEKQLTALGVCCHAQAEKLNAGAATNPLLLNPKLDLVLQCSDRSLPNGCEFYTMYHGEEFVSPLILTTGLTYKVQVTSVTVQDSNVEALSLSGGCISNPTRSRQMCQIQCKEKQCGCSDPLRLVHSYEQDVPPKCSIQKMNCLRNFKLLDKSCNCPEACKKVTTDLSIEASAMDQTNNTFDSFFHEVNVSNSTVLSVTIQDRGSKVFELMHTETWWSLLSTLGGVFNMFLGVGLFSALELLFFLFWRLPASMRRYADFNASASY